MTQRRKPKGTREGGRFDYGPAADTPVALLEGIQSSMPDVVNASINGVPIEFLRHNGKWQASINNISSTKIGLASLMDDPAYATIYEQNLEAHIKASIVAEFMDEGKLQPEEVDTLLAKAIDSADPMPQEVSTKEAILLRWMYQRTRFPVQALNAFLSDEIRYVPDHYQDCIPPGEYLLHDWAAEAKHRRNSNADLFTFFKHMKNAIDDYASPILLASSLSTKWGLELQPTVFADFYENPASFEIDEWADENYWDGEDYEYDPETGRGYTTLWGWQQGFLAPYHKWAYGQEALSGWERALIILSRAHISDTNSEDFQLWLKYKAPQVPVAALMKVATDDFSADGDNAAQILNFMWEEAYNNPKSREHLQQELETYITQGRLTDPPSQQERYNKIRRTFGNYQLHRDLHSIAVTQDLIANPL